MKNSRHTKRALFTSVLSMMLCMAMLIGSTFAWFTDSVTSGKNKIVAGNLDIELEYTKDFITWTSVEGKTNLFDANALWEPGHAEVVYLRLKNLGSLALKYKFALNIDKETKGTNVSGEEFALSDYLQYGVVENQQMEFDDRDTAIKAVTNPTVLTAYSKEGKMAAGAEEQYLAIVVYMPTTVGNEANYRGTVPSIDLSLSLLATQDTVESDSFGTDYDADAPNMLPDGVTEQSFTENNALAYANNQYYEKVEDAVAQGGTIYLKPNSTTDLTGAHTIIPGNGITIYANGATFNHDLSIDTYDYSAQGKSDGIFDGIDTVNITVYDAKNLYLWGQRNSEATVNIRMVNCENTGIDSLQNPGRTVYLTGTTGTTNIVLENARISNTDSPVYSNANGKIELRNCTFTDCAVPVNINYKSTSGKQEVIIDGCSFVNCGVDSEYSYGDGTMGDYAAPIRVVHSVAGSEHTVTVKNTSVTGTKGGNGDMLIFIHKHGTQDVTAILENNLTDIRVDTGKRNGNTTEFVVVSAGTSNTIHPENQSTSN